MLRGAKGFRDAGLTWKRIQKNCCKLQESLDHYYRDLLEGGAVQTGMGVLCHSSDGTFNDTYMLTGGSQGQVGR